MANVEESVHNDPNFAVICSFIEKFGELCGISNLTIANLQEMLEDTRTVHQDLIDLHVKLLRRTGKKSVPHDKWEKVVVKYCHGYSKVDAWEIERFGYKKAKLTVKLNLLKRLLEAQFDAIGKFKNEVNKLSAEQLRLLPIGKDLKGLMYWFQLDSDLNLRVYCEDQDEETWDLVVKERNELVNLIETLETDENSGVKKEEDSTTPSDTGESKDEEASLMSSQVNQDKNEKIPVAKLEFHVTSTLNIQEKKPPGVKLEMPVPESKPSVDILSTTVKEEKPTMKVEVVSLELKSVVKTEKTEENGNKALEVEPKNSSLDLPEEKSQAVVDIKPTLEESHIKMKEETVIKQECLEDDDSEKSATTDRLLPKNVKGDTTDCTDNKLTTRSTVTAVEIDAERSSPCRNLYSSIRASVIKLAEKPVLKEDSLIKASTDSSLLNICRTVNQQSVNSLIFTQDEAADLSITRQEIVEKKVLDSMVADPNKGSITSLTETITDPEPPIQQPFVSLAPAVHVKEVSTISKVEQELKEKRCERMMMPLKKREIPKDLDTGSVTVVLKEDLATLSKGVVALETKSRKTDSLPKETEANPDNIKGGENLLREISSDVNVKKVSEVPVVSVKVGHCNSPEVSGAALLPENDLNDVKLQEVSNSSALSMKLPEERGIIIAEKPELEERLHLNENKKCEDVIDSKTETCNSDKTVAFHDTGQIDEDRSITKENKTMASETPSLCDEIIDAESKGLKNSATKVEHKNARSYDAPSLGSSDSVSSHSETVLVVNCEKNETSVTESEVNKSFPLENESERIIFKGLKSVNDPLLLPSWTPASPCAESDLNKQKKDEEPSKFCVKSKNDEEPKIIRQESDSLRKVTIVECSEKVLEVDVQPAKSTICGSFCTSSLPKSIEDDALKLPGGPTVSNACLKDICSGSKAVTTAENSEKNVHDTDIVTSKTEADKCTETNNAIDNEKLEVSEKTSAKETEARKSVNDNRHLICEKLTKEEKSLRKGDVINVIPHNESEEQISATEKVEENQSQITAINESSRTAMVCEMTELQKTNVNTENVEKCLNHNAEGAIMTDHCEKEIIKNPNPLPERRMTRSLRSRQLQPVLEPIVITKLGKKMSKAANINATKPTKSQKTNQSKVTTPSKSASAPKAVTPIKPAEKVTIDLKRVSVTTTPKPGRKKRKRDPEVIEESEDYTPIKRSQRLRAQRQKQEEEQRRIEEDLQRQALLEQQRLHQERKKKQELKEKKEKEEARERELLQKKKDKKKKKKISKRRRNKKGSNPWDVSSESTSQSSSEPEEANGEVEEEEEELVFNERSDHEFSPETEPDDDDPNFVPAAIKRARTVKKAKGSSDDDSSEGDDKPCTKCEKYDHPEWILLCDKCDNGYHTSCLRPPLMVIPDGDWFCPPCSHRLLVEKLHEHLKILDQLLKKREREEMRKKRLAFVGISLDNVLKPEKPKKEVVGEEEEYEDDDDDEDYILMRKRSRRPRKEVSYRFKEFDELINSAIQDEVISETGTAGIGKGKDMSNITNAAILRDEDQDIEDELCLIKRKRRHRRLNDLDTSTEEDDSDEDFRGSSSNSEQPSEEESAGVPEDSDDSWQGSRRGFSSGRSSHSRRRSHHYGDDDFINDSEEDSEDNRRTVRRAATRSVNYKEISDSDDDRVRHKKRLEYSKGRKTFSDDTESDDSDWRTSKKHSKHGNGTSSEKNQKTGRKSWRIESTDDDDDDDDEDGDNVEDDEKGSEEGSDKLVHRTRGKRTNYREVPDSSEEEQKVLKKSRLSLKDFEKNSDDTQTSDQDEEEEEEDEDDDDDEEDDDDDDSGKEEEESGTGEKEVKSEAVVESEVNKNKVLLEMKDESDMQNGAVKTCEDTPDIKSEEKMTIVEVIVDQKSSLPDASRIKQRDNDDSSRCAGSIETSVDSTKEECEASHANDVNKADSEVADASKHAPPECSPRTNKHSVIKSVESVKKAMLGVADCTVPTSHLGNDATLDEPDLSDKVLHPLPPVVSSPNAKKDDSPPLPQKSDSALKSPVDEVAFSERLRPSDYQDRPSPLKPSAVEPYPVRSSPSKLTLLDNYPCRGSPQSKLTSLEPYSTSVSSPSSGLQPYDRPRPQGPLAGQYHGEYGNFPGQYYSPNYPPPSGSHYSPSPPMPGYQSSPNPYPPYQQHSPNYNYIPSQGYDQGPYHGQTQQYGSYGSYSPPPAQHSTTQPPHSQPNGRFSIDNLLQRRMEGATEEDDLSTVNDLVSYITGSHENPL